MERGDSCVSIGRDRGTRDYDQQQARTRTEGTKLQDLLVLVVEAGEPGGEALDRRLELRVQVDEVAQPLGQPLQAHRLLAAPLRQLLDTAVGEVHAQLRGSAASMRAACS